MKLNIEKPIVFFDLETTGVNVAKDRILEISLIKINPDQSQETITQRINPCMSIPEEATAIHGITNDDVKDCPEFSEVAEKFSSMMKGCDLAGFNILRFDLPILVEEMLRAGIKDFPEKNTKFIDAMAIYHHFEKRDLAAALKFYCGKDHKQAHSAEDDVIATIEVLQSQIEKYKLDSDTIKLHELSSNGKEIIDFDGKFIRNENGDIVFNFSKDYKGKRVVEEPGFVNWMLRADFITYDTKEKAKRIINGNLV